MNISIYDRIKYGCNCYMCNDERSASCIELSALYRIGSYDTSMGFDPVFQEIKKIRQQIKKDSLKLFKTYLLCLYKFNRLYESVIEKRYSPPNGKGYIECKNRFEKIYIMDEDDVSSEYFQYKLS